MIKGDLQYIKQNTYVVILTVKIFKALMTVVVAFDFDTRQYDAVNAFANNFINETIYCKPSKK